MDSLRLAIYLYEGKKTDYAVAIGSGLVGPLAGSAAGGYYRVKGTQLKKEMARRKGKNVDDENDVGWDIANAAVGSVPVVGSFTNAMAVKRYHRLKEKYEKQMEKRKK